MDSDSRRSFAVGFQRVAKSDEVSFEILGIARTSAGFLIGLIWISTNRTRPFYDQEGSLKRNQYCTLRRFRETSNDFFFLVSLATPEHLTLTYTKKRKFVLYRACTVFLSFGLTVYLDKYTKLDARSFVAKIFIFTFAMYSGLRSQGRFRNELLKRSYTNA